MLASLFAVPAMPDWPIPCDVCGQIRRLDDLTVTRRPVPGMEDWFPAGACRHVCHCPDRWWCRAYAAMPGPWRGRPVLAIEGQR